MKGKTMLMAVLALFVAGAAYAQMTEKTTGKGPLKERVSNFWKQAKETADGVVTKVQDSFENENSGLRRVKGKYYMNLYDTNLYKGADSEELLALCRKEFVAKYPAVTVKTVVIPQKDWETSTVETDGKVTGYAQTLYCYVFAKDGEEGFINAKFVFERQKKVGEPTMGNKVKWPLWIRTDVLTHDVYEHLLTK